MAVPSWKLEPQYFDHLMRRADSLEKTVMLGKIEGKRRRGRQRVRRLDGISDSLDVNWASSRRPWRTEEPGTLQSMGSQRVRHDSATEQQSWRQPKCPPTDRQTKTTELTWPRSRNLHQTCEATSVETWTVFVQRSTPRNTKSSSWLTAANGQQSRILPSSGGLTTRLCAALHFSNILKKRCLRMENRFNAARPWGQGEERVTEEQRGCSGSAASPLRLHCRVYTAICQNALLYTIKFNSTTCKFLFLKK